MACFIANTQRTEQTRRSYPLPPSLPILLVVYTLKATCYQRSLRGTPSLPLTQTILSMSISKRVLSYPTLSLTVLSTEQAYPKVTGKGISPQQWAGTHNIVCITPPISLSTSSFPISKLFLSPNFLPTLPYPPLLPPSYFPTKQPGLPLHKLPTFSYSPHPPNQPKNEQK